MAERMSIEKWDRFFALYDGDELVCVTVYKKGALEVKRRLEELRERGGLTMWNIPSKERLKKLPRLYETEHIALKDKLIYLHFFIGACDWYIAEFDGDDLFWGYAILNDDHQNAEWGYISFRELKEIKIKGWLEVDCELEENWKVRKASEIERIRNL